MLSSEEIFELLKTCPEGYLKPDHKLFTVNSKNLLQTYKKLGAINGKDDESVNGEIFCNVYGCSMIFDSVAAYQSHYNIIHRFICSECKKSMPTDHLLDLHLSEQHDSYFQAQVDRGERLFKCYLKDCKVIFENPAERKEHCIKQHKFPSNFRYDQVGHKNIQHITNKLSKSTEDHAMELVEEAKLENSKPKDLKIFSFGHHREKAFRSRNGCKQKLDTGKTLENMNSLMEALEQW